MGRRIAGLGVEKPLQDRDGYTCIETTWPKGDPITDICEEKIPFYFSL